MLLGLVDQSPIFHDRRRRRNLCEVRPADVVEDPRAERVDDGLDAGDRERIALLADICRSLPAKPVELTLEGPRVSLTCGSARFSLQTMPVEDYPALPTVPEASGVVKGEEFAKAVSQAVTAAGRDDMLPVLTGVRIEIDSTRAAPSKTCWPSTPARATASATRST